MQVFQLQHHTFTLSLTIMPTNVTPDTGFYYFADFQSDFVKLDSGREKQNNYMEGPGTAAMKKHSLSQAPRGRENSSEQKPHNYK